MVYLQNLLGCRIKIGKNKFIFLIQRIKMHAKWRIVNEFLIKVIAGITGMLCQYKICNVLPAGT
ncbi:hypothetical protein DSECCO2_641170 [anaerobic digester metagenome]